MAFMCDARRQTITVPLVFKRSEIVYDAENYSFVEGDIMKADDEHSRHQVFDIAQEGNIDRVTRMLNLAFAECVEMLYPYTKTEIPTTQEAINDILKVPEEYTITLNLPDGFSLSTVNLLSELIHEYFVCRVLADWFSISNAPSEKVWLEKLQDTGMAIRSSLLQRVKTVRRRTKPF